MNNLLDNISIKCQEDVKKSEHLTPSENKIVKGPDDSTQEIKTDSTGNEWIDIGGVKSWIRYCPDCGSTIFHTDKNTCRKKIKSKAKCYPCGLKNRKKANRVYKKRTISINELTRKCPKCHLDIIYTNKYNRNNAEKEKRLCKLCYAKSTRMYDTPDILERSCPSCGKVIEYSMGKDLSVRRTRWLRDTRENRICNKCARSGKNNGAYGLVRVGKDNPNYGKKWNEEKRDAAREFWSKKYVERGYIFNNYNPLACKYLDQLSTKMGWNLKHAENGGEVVISGYFIDGYDTERNIVVEYDEAHHFKDGKLCTEDLDRMRKIIQTTGCQFYRYNEAKDEFIKYE